MSYDICPGCKLPTFRCECSITVAILRAENVILKDSERKWMDCVEQLASAGYRLMQLAGGADVPDGDMQFACKEGMFSEQIAHQRIKALLRASNEQAVVP